MTNPEPPREAAKPSSHLLLLNEIAGIVGEARSLQDVLDRVVRLVAERMRTDVCSIWLLDARGTQLTLAATEGLSAMAVGQATLAKGQGVTWRVFEELQPVIVEDVQKDPSFVYIPSTREDPFNSFLALPLLVRGSPIGAMSVQTREQRSFTTDEVRAFQAIASQIAPVVDNARLLAILSREETVPVPLAASPGARRAVGTPCSSGVVVGRILRLGAAPPRAADGPGTIVQESAILTRACNRARAELTRMQAWLRQRNADEAALVFSAQLMFLEDPAFEGRMRAAVEQGASARDAVERVMQNLLQRFSAMKDVYFRERAADVQDLAFRLLRHAQAGAPEGSDGLRGRIAVLPLLTPSRLVSLSAEGVTAVLSGGGGATSHAALLARSLDLPLVVGLGDFVDQVADGERALVDASTGEVLLDPPDALLRELERAESAPLPKLPKGRRRSRIRIEANVNLWGDALRARANGADGIGLYRTEFAFLLRPDLPSEEDQALLYRRIVEEMAPQPVTFRLLDAGGDKLLPALGGAIEPNPFLGYRSLRILLDHPEILGPQIRAVLRALKGTHGSILVPMVSSVKDMRAIRERLLDVRRRLPPLGAMIEVPSALLQVRELAEEADFLSVGTNDLTQHLLGVDRTNARVTRYFDHCDPAVLRAIDAVCRAGRGAGKPVGVCGGMASDPLFATLWVGLGVDRLSVHIPRIPLLRAVLASIRVKEARRATHQLLEMDSAEAIRKRLEELAAAAGAPIVHARV
ncbi:MAG: phosphoenolpyruvate--protein phosphotransferase [Planctomycetaceae bacterium]